MLMANVFKQQQPLTHRTPISRLLMLMSAFILLGMPTSSLAATLYQFEFIIFKRLDNSNTEQQPPNAETAYKKRAVNAALSNTGNFGVKQLKALSKNQLKLNNVYNQLRASSNFRPLLIGGWQQTIAKRAKPLTLSITTPWEGGTTQGQASPGAERIMGTLSFRRSRYLHVDAELGMYRQLTAQDAYGESQFDNQDRDFSNPNGYAESNISAISLNSSNDMGLERIIRSISESRRMRSNELHYIDNPSFGVLIQVSRVK